MITISILQPCAHIPKWTLGDQDTISTLSPSTLSTLQRNQKAICPEQQQRNSHVTNTLMKRVHERYVLYMYVCVREGGGATLRCRVHVMSAENIRKVKVIVLGDSGEFHVAEKLHLNTPNFFLSDYVTFFSSLPPPLPPPPPLAFLICCRCRQDLSCSSHLSW